MHQPAMLEIDKLVCDFALRALAVVGSRARGDSGKFSDLDLIGIGNAKAFHTLTQLQYVTELHVYTDTLAFRQKPSWWYALEDMKIVVDDGSFAELLKRLPAWKSAFKSDLEEVVANRHWLESSKRKLQNSRTEVEVSYAISTSFWQILSGHFLVRDMPVPASSDMFRLAPQLIGKTRFEELLTGTYSQRKTVALELINEVIH